MLPKLIGRLLLGTSFFTGAILLSNPPGMAASLSEIPLDAVTIQYEEPPISTSPLTLGFQVSVANLPEIDPSVKLTSFTATLTRSDGNTFGSNVRAWTASAASGWQVFGIAESAGNPGGYRFDALSPEYGILPGDTLSGFVARSSAGSIENTSLQVTSASSTSAVPEPNSALLNTLAISVFLGTRIALKRKQRQPRLASRSGCTCQNTQSVQ